MKSPSFVGVTPVFPFPIDGDSCLAAATGMPAKLLSTCLGLNRPETVTSGGLFRFGGAVGRAAGRVARLFPTTGGSSSVCVSPGNYPFRGGEGGADENKKHTCGGSGIKMSKAYRSYTF